MTEANAIMGNLFWFTALLCALAGHRGLAETYAERLTANTEIIFVENSATEARLKAWMISRARSRIDANTLITVPDRVGLPIVQALRGAANRGVPIRFSYDRTSSLANFDFFDDFGALLSDRSLKAPPEVIVVKDKDKARNDLARDDTSHEKIISIDRGTPNEMIMLCGSNMHNFALRTLDSGFIIRPIDPSKPYLGTDINHNFDTLWGFLSARFPTRAPADLGMRRRQLASREVPDTTEGDAKARSDFGRIVKVLSKPASSADTLAPFQFHPQSVQFISNQVLQQLTEESPAPENIAEREAILDQHIIHKVSDLIRNARKIDIQGYVIAPPPELERALKEAIARGAKVNYYTNGNKAQNSVPLPAPAWAISKLMGLFNAVYDYTLKQSTPLLETGEREKGDFRLWAYNAERVAGEVGGDSKRQYIHRKLMIVDDYVISGSDNFTRASSAKAQESVFVVKDPRMAEYLRGRLRAQQKLYDRIDAKTAISLWKHRGILSDALCAHFVSRFY